MKPNNWKAIIERIVILTFLWLFVACEDLPKTEKERFTEIAKREITFAENFAYPVGKTGFVTEARDADEWYNALDFTENNHLGEDWNKMSGGDSDCGESVYSIGNGEIIYAQEAGSGWGNVVIIEHHLPDGKKIQSLYGHLSKIDKLSGWVKKREKIGEIGNANGKYKCHLHLEIRDESCLAWNEVFVGYSSQSTGWLDPSDFIEKNK